MATNERTFFGHPWGLANLFGVEMWERFSFYGLQAILLYYLYYQTTDGGLGIDESIATAIVGAYGGLVYVAAIGGGWVADRVLGAERTLFYSAIIVMLGHVSLGLLPGILGLTVGLMLVALGSGGVKTTASTVLGGLYEEGDRVSTAATPSSTWASTSARSSAHWSPAGCGGKPDSTGVLAWLRSAWPSASFNTPSCAKTPSVPWAAPC